MRRCIYHNPLEIKSSGCTVIEIESCCWFVPSCFTCSDSSALVFHVIGAFAWWQLTNSRKQRWPAVVLNPETKELSKHLPYAVNIWMDFALWFCNCIYHKITQIEHQHLITRTMTVTIPKQRNTNDRYMEQSKINSDHPTSNPTQQAVNSSSSTQPINSTVLQTTQSKKLSVNFLLNSPEEEHEDRLSLQPVHLPTTTLQSDKFTFVTSTNRTNLQSNSFHNLHEHSQNTLSPYSSNDSPLKRVHLEDGSNLPSKRPKSDPDNFVKQSSLSR